MSSSVTLENSPRHRGGWTNIDPRPTTVEIFVDATGGDDANDGLSEGNAVETIGAGYALLRDGYPDHLCLKRGEEWTASLGQSSGDLWNKSGAGPDDPMIVKPYGTGARPKIIKQSQGIRIEGNASVTVEDFQIHGIEFEPSSETGRGTCIWIISTVTRFLMEDCHIHGYVSNVTIQAGSYSDETGPHTDVALRRNVITDAHPDSGHSQGCFIADSRNVLLEGNILDSNGLDGAAGGGGGGGTLFNHNFYIANSNKRVVSRENVSVRSSSYGLMQRPGGRIERNLFIECPHAILFGSHESSQLTRWPDGIDCFGRDNVILDGTYRSGVGSGGLGIQTEEVRRALIENNLVARYDTGLSGSPGAIYHDAINGGGTNDTIVRANITYEWESGMKLTVGTKCDGVRWIDNHLQNGQAIKIVSFTSDEDGYDDVQMSHNKFYSGMPAGQWYKAAGSNLSFATFAAAMSDTTSTEEQVTYPDPDKTLADYSTIVGGAGTLADVFAELRAQSRTNWRHEYTAPAIAKYCRGNFDMPGPSRSIGALQHGGRSVGAQQAVYAEAMDLMVTTMTLPSVVEGDSYAGNTVQAVGGTSPYTFSVVSGSLPTGLSLSSAGVFIGTATSSGTYNFTVRVTDDDSDTDDQALSIVVLDPVDITTTTLPNGTESVMYSQTVVATGGATPYTFSHVSGTMPPGVAEITSAGVITGTPTIAGTYPITVRVTDDDSNTDDQALSITVNPAVAPVDGEGTVVAAVARRHRSFIARRRR